MHAACAAIDADIVLALQKPSGRFFLFTCEKCLNQGNITSSKVLSNNVSVQCSSFLTSQTTQTDLEYSQSPHTDEEGVTTDHIPERRVCRFHIRRGCRKAENCTFLHICLDYFKGICRDECCILPHRSLCKKFAHGLCFMNCCPNVHLTSPRRKKLRSNTELRSSKNGERKIPPLLKHGCQRQQFTVPLMSLKLKPPVLNQPMQIPPPSYQPLLVKTWRNWQEPTSASLPTIYPVLTTNQFGISKKSKIHPPLKPCLPSIPTWNRFNVLARRFETAV